MIDIQMNEFGDIQIDPISGDFVLVTGDEALAQQVLFRLKTYVGDWTLSPQIGCSLEDFIGQPNTDNTHSVIEQRIVDQLSYDGLLNSPDVSAVPLSDNEVFILIEFNSSDGLGRVVQIQANLDLKIGLVFSRVLVRN